MGPRPLSIVQASLSSDSRVAQVDGATQYTAAHVFHLISSSRQLIAIPCSHHYANMSNTIATQYYDKTPKHGWFYAAATRIKHNIVNIFFNGPSDYMLALAVSKGIIDPIHQLTLSPSTTTFYKPNGANMITHLFDYLTAYIIMSSLSWFAIIVLLFVVFDPLQWQWIHCLRRSNVTRISARRRQLQSAEKLAIFLVVTSQYYPAFPWFLNSFWSHFAFHDTLITFTCLWSSCDKKWL